LHPKEGIQMMEGEGLSNEDRLISSEIVEIGCMCVKCNCKKVVPLVVSICNSCLKDNHSNKIE